MQLTQGLTQTQLIVKKNNQKARLHSAKLGTAIQIKF